MCWKQLMNAPDVTGSGKRPATPDAEAIFRSVYELAAVVAHEAALDFNGGFRHPGGLLQTCAPVCRL